MLTRRRFIATTACTIAAARLHTHGQSKVRVALAIPNEATGPHMPIDFVGLSYEVQQLVDPSFFSAQNSGLIREFKALSSTGVLRLGGNTSEFAYWKPTPDSPEPEHPQVREAEGEPKAHYYAVTPEAVKNLSEFLQNVASGSTLAAGQSEAIFQIRAADADPNFYHLLDAEARYKIEAESCFCSVLDNCWITDFKVRPERVKACEPIPDNQRW
jgi:hypothetical protein